VTDGHPVIETVVDQLLTMFRAVVVLRALKVRLLKQAEDPMCLMLRVREMSKILESDAYISRHCWQSKRLQFRHS
jgi:hypothetical protein